MKKMPEKVLVRAYPNPKPANAKCKLRAGYRKRRKN